MCCCVLLCVAVCFGVLLCVDVCYSMLQSSADCYREAAEKMRTCGARIQKEP